MSLHRFVLLFVMVIAQPLSAGTTSKIPTPPGNLVEAVLNGNIDIVQRTFGIETPIDQRFVLHADGIQPTTTMTMLGFAASIAASNAVNSLLQLGANPFLPIESSDGSYDLPIDACYDFKEDKRSFACVSLLATAMKATKPELATNLWNSIVIRLNRCVISNHCVFVGYESIATKDEDKSKLVILGTNAIVCENGIVLSPLSPKREALFYRNDVRSLVLNHVRNYINSIQPYPLSIHLENITQESAILDETPSIVIVDVIAIDDRFSFKPFFSALVAFGQVQKGSEIQISGLQNLFFVLHDGVYISTHYPLGFLPNQK